MGFWDQPYPGQPIDPGMPPGYQPPVDPLTAALMAQKNAASNFNAPGAEFPMSGMGATPDQQAAAASIFHRFVDPFVQAETLPQRVIEGQPVDPVSEGLNFAGAMTMPSLGRAAMGGLPQDLMSMSGAADKPGIIAYHGSPHSFDQFDISKIGTGEGAQAYGHGLYFAGNEDVAKGYRDALSSRGPTVGMKYDGPLPYGADLGFISRKVLDEKGPQAALDDVVARMKDQAGFYDRTYGNNSGQPNLYTHAAEAFASLDPDKLGVQKGSMYQVSINADPEHFLDWDKPLSEQSPKVQEAVSRMAQKYGVEPDMSITGEDAYHSVAMNLGDDPNIIAMSAAQQAGSPHAAEHFRDAGIPGIKYLDAGSRNRPSDFYVRQDLSADPLADEILGINSGKYYVASSALNRHAGPFDNRADAQSWIKSNTPQPTSNYVTFSDDIISILKKYGLAGLGLAGYGASQNQAPPQSQ